LLSTLENYTPKGIKKKKIILIIIIIIIKLAMRKTYFYKRFGGGHKVSARQTLMLYGAIGVNSPWKQCVC